MSPINIRKAKISDSKCLAKLAHKTYCDTFQSHPMNDPKDFLDYVDNAFSPIQISKELSNDNAIFLIAEFEDEPIGYAKLELFSKEPSIEGEKPIELNRIYSDKEFIGKGLGQTLLTECTRTAKKLNCDVMWLGVWEHNPRAIRFYEKNGFHKVGSHLFQMGADKQTDLLMLKNL